MSNPNWNVYLINRSVNVAMSVDKSKICHVWLDFGSVPTPESVSASNFTPGTDSTCSDATNTVSPDSANQNRAFGTCGGSGTRTGTVPPLMLGQKWSSPSPEHLNRSTGRSNMHLKHLETSEGLQPMWLTGWNLSEALGVGRYEASQGYTSREVAAAVIWADYEGYSWSQLRGRNAKVLYRSV